MNARSSGYLTHAAVSAGLAIVAALAVNALVDPYRILGTPAISGLSVVKPRAQQHRVEGKRFQVARVAPKTIILGNSRAEVGFDPESEAWPLAARPVYNLAIPGSGIAAARDELARVLAVHEPDRLVIGVEFLDFLTDVRPRALPPPEGAFEPWDRARVMMNTLLSLDALADSLRTVVSQHDRYAPDLTVLGFNPMREYVRFAEAEGYFGLFRQRYLESRRVLGRAPRTIWNEKGVSPDFSALEEVLETARRRSLRVDLVAYPYHATQLLLFDDVGLWDAFDSWKRELAKLAGRYLGVTVSDFAVFNEFTQQPIPAPDQRPGTSPWYWEAGHFKRALGDQLLRDIMACDREQACGTLLPPAGPLLDSHLARQRSMLGEYRSAMQKTSSYMLLVAPSGAPK